MEVNLWDIGRRRQAALLQGRVAAINNHTQGPRGPFGVAALPAAPPGPPRRLGTLARCWARGTGSPPETVGDAVEAMRGPINGVRFGLAAGSLGFWGPAVAVLAAGGAGAGDVGFGVTMASLGALMSGVGLWMPGVWVRRLCRPPVSAAEVDALLAAATDDLERAYLRLTADVVRQAVAPDAAGRVREALRAVGEAVEQLPVVNAPRAGAETLRAEAARARDEARGESDPVVAASHGRRADALDRSADAALRSHVLARRASALRAEMMAQIESLRLGLAGFETASGDVAGLASLADAVRNVATESLSVADARAELDAWLPGGPAAAPPLRLRAGGG